MDLFINGWIFPGLNSNSIVFIPKLKGANVLEQLCPIVISNFKLKLITKIIVDRLVVLMPFLISKEQHGFIQGKMLI